MEPTQQLIDALWLDKVNAAKETAPALKFRAGPDLFDDVIQWMSAGIRNQFPGISEDDVLRQLDRRLAIAERLENR